MIIKVTQEMIDMANAATRPSEAAQAIVDIIERDYIVQRRCPETLMPDVRCVMAEHTGEHWATLHTGARVNWSNVQ